MTCRHVFHSYKFHVLYVGQNIWYLFFFVSLLGLLTKPGVARHYKERYGRMLWLPYRLK